MRTFAVTVLTGLAVGGTLAGCGGAETLTDGTSPQTSTSGAVAAYVPQYVPAGYRLCLAQDARTADGPSGTEDPAVAAGARTWIYGDLDRTDPWSGPLAIVIDHRGSAQEFGPAYTNEGSRPARVHGVRGSVGPASFGDGVVPGWGSSAMWVERPGHVVEVALRGGTPAAAIRLAGRVVMRGNDPQLPANALGGRTAPLQTPAQARQDVPTVTQLSFERIPQGAADPGDLLQLNVHATRPTEAAAAAATALRATTVTIAGADGTLLATRHAGRGPFSVIWQVGSGRTGVISSLSLPGGELVKMAQSVHGIDRVAWEDYAAGANAC